MSRVRNAAAVIGLVLALTSCGSSKPSNDGRTFTIEGPSMQPTFKKGDKVTIEDAPATLKVGMVVVFKDPAGWSSSTGKPVTQLKRILGVGGDRVRCCDAAGLLTINGTAMDESSYLPNGIKASDDTFDVRVPAGYLWVMGDDRPDSFDSRGHMGDPGGGFVPVKNVIGVVVQKSRPVS